MANVVSSSGRYMALSGFTENAPASRKKDGTRARSRIWGLFTTVWKSSKWNPLPKTPA
jgi:hypothetical protein